MSPVNIPTVNPKGANFLDQSACRSLQSALVGARYKALASSPLVHPGSCILIISRNMASSKITVLPEPVGELKTQLKEVP